MIVCSVVVLVCVEGSLRSTVVHPLTRSSPANPSSGVRLLPGVELTQAVSAAGWVVGFMVEESRRRSGQSLWGETLLAEVPAGRVIPHRTAAVPSTTTHDVDATHSESVGVADDGPDVHVVFPVLDRHLDRKCVSVQIVTDGLHAPVAEAVDDVSPVAFGEQLRVQTRVVGPRQRVRADPG